MDDMDLKTIELGHTFDYRELQSRFRLIYGGVSFPGKRPGCACVVGMTPERHFDNHDLYLLDEFESFDLRSLIRQCFALDRKYYISFNDYDRTALRGRWMGPGKNNAADRFIQEVNDEFNKDNRDDYPFTNWFYFDASPLFEMENLYPYILSEIKALLDSERRQLFLKDSLVASYLSGIKPEDVVDLQLGDFPAIEALTFAMIEIRQDDLIAERSMKYRRHNVDSYPNWKRFKRRA